MSLLGQVVFLVCLFVCFWFGGARVFNIVSMLTHYLVYIAIPSPPPTCALSLTFIQNEEIFRYQAIQAREGIVLVQPGSFFCLSTSWSASWSHFPLSEKVWYWSLSSESRNGILSRITCCIKNHHYGIKLCLIYVTNSHGRWASMVNISPFPIYHWIQVVSIPLVVLWN